MSFFLPSFLGWVQLPTLLTLITAFSRFCSLLFHLSQCYHHFQVFFSQSLAPKTDFGAFIACRLRTAIGFRYCNHLQVPLQAPALTGETHSQVYSPSFLSGEQIQFPLFQSRGGWHMSNFDLFRLSLDSGGCSPERWTCPLWRLWSIWIAIIQILWYLCTKISGTCSSSVYDTHDTVGELQTYFCCVPVSGTSALQVTWGWTKAN